MLDLYKIMGIYHAFKFRQRMSDEKKNWTGNIQLGAKTDLNVVLNQLCKAFNNCPFFKHWWNCGNGTSLSSLNAGNPA